MEVQVLETSATLTDNTRFLEKQLEAVIKVKTSCKSCIGICIAACIRLDTCCSLMKTSGLPHPEIIQDFVCWAGESRRTGQNSLSSKVSLAVW